MKHLYKLLLILLISFLTITSITSCKPNKAIIITNPVGGEIWGAGTTQTIEWTTEGEISNVKIELWDGIKLYDTLEESIQNTGNYQWDIPFDIEGDDSYIIRIIDTENEEIFGESESKFSIAEERIRVTSPQGGEAWALGSSQTIEWITEGVITNVKIELWKDNAIYKQLSANHPNTGFYEWDIIKGGDSGIETGEDYQVKVTYSANSDIFGISNEHFSVIQQPIEIIHPNDTTIWMADSQQTIQWTTTSGVTVDNVDIEIWLDGELNSTLAQNITNSGSYIWDIPSNNTASIDYTVKMYDSSDNSVSGESYQFAIYNADLVGEWISTPDNDLKLDFDEDKMTVYDYNSTSGEYEASGEGIYTYYVDDDIISGYATKINPSNFDDTNPSDDLVDLPYSFDVQYTDPDSGMTITITITIKTMEVATSFVMNSMLVNPEALLGAYLGTGDTGTLIGLWEQTMEITGNADLEYAGETTNYTFNDSVGDKYEFTSTNVTYTYYEYEEFNPGGDDPEPTEVIETAQWGSLDTINKTFVVTGGDTNEQLVNGTYKYMVMGDAIFISKPSDQNGTADDVPYLIKQ